MEMEMFPRGITNLLKELILVHMKFHMESLMLLPGLEYDAETGAINESFADIFGVLVDCSD